MAAVALLSLIILVVGSVITTVQRTWKQSSSRIDQFREARRAMETINRRLSQATLNVYWDYVDADGNLRPAADSVNVTFVPAKYARQSELRYAQLNSSTLTPPHGGTLVGQAVFFQAPVGQTEQVEFSGMSSLLNTIGYYVEKSDDTTLRPPTSTGDPKTRYRLYEMAQPSETLTVYSKTSENAGYGGKEWYQVPLAEARNSHRLSNNIVALILQAEYPDASGNTQSVYAYDSTPQTGTTTQPIEVNNLPPLVRVTLVAVDEAAGRMIEQRNLNLPSVVDDASLKELEKILIQNNLSYRKFQTAVRIGSAKWSVQ